MQSKYQDLIKKVEKHFCSNRYKTEMQAFIRDVEYQFNDLKARLKKLEPAEPEDISTDKDGHPLRKGNLIKSSGWGEPLPTRHGIFSHAERMCDNIGIYARWENKDHTFDKTPYLYVFQKHVTFLAHLPETDCD